MKSIRKIVILSLLMVLVVGCGKVPTLKNGEQKVASITGSGVSADSLYAKMKIKYGAQEFVDLLDAEILNKKYKEDETEKEHIKSQVDELKSSAKKNNITLNDILSYYGFKDEDSLKDYLRLSYRRDKAVDEYVAKTIKDSEVNKYYENEIYGDIKAKHILISPDTSSDMTSEQKKEAEKKAKKEAEDIIKKLDKGEKFEDLAKKYSDDSSNAKKGGDLGWIAKGDMVDEFDAAAFKLKKGKYTTSPVKTTYGYHVILKVDEKDKPKLKNVKKKILSELTDKKLEDDKTLYYTTLDNIRKDAGLKFEDKELRKYYSEYLQKQKNQATQSSSSN